MILVNSTLLVFGSLFCTDVRMLYFTMDGCPPCHQMEPNVDRMAADGISVEKINLSRRPQLAVDYRVTHTPTVVFVDDRRVLMRHSGPLTYNDLRQMFQACDRAVAAESARRQNPAANGPTSSRTSATHSTSKTNLSPEQRAHQATVRLRVQDETGMSFATGTIIHRVNQEALVLTCGHVFRDSQGRGQIHADIGFAMDQSQTVTGKLLFYDSEHHDVALVAIPCELPIEPVPVAPPSMVMQTGDQVFSFGCDRGDPPSMRRSVLKAVTRYSGVDKYDTVGRPVDGRSGGGLFSLGGQLVGVCNAAAVEVDEGIYAGLPSIHWQFGTTNLAHLFSPATVHDGQPQIAQNQPREIQRIAGSNPGRTSQPLRTAPTPGTVQAIDASQGPAFDAGSVEVIMLVRSKTNPDQVETITIQNPDARVMQMIQQNRGGIGGPQERLAGGRSLPDLDPRMLDRGTTVRGQSPK